MGWFDLFSEDSATTNNETTDRSYSVDRDIEEYAQEPLSTTGSDNFANPYSSYAYNGIKLNDIRNAIELVYSGALAKSNASELFAVVGYGSNLRWENVQYYPMQKVDSQTYKVIFPVNYAGSINVAFKDAANNWDNNTGLNYTFNNNYYTGNH